MSESIRIRVPASTANLGSGYDCLGMALALHDTVVVRPGEGAPGTAVVEVSGSGAGRVPTDERHLVVRAMHATLSELGVPAPGVRMWCENVIPHSRGLGSSAAAIVAGVAAAYALAGRDVHRDVERALRIAAGFEGHADNAAASLLGGLAIVWEDKAGFRGTRLVTHPDVRPVALVPTTVSTTRTTRGLLPASVPHVDAAFAASRSSLAVHALTRDPTLLFPATEDRLHQDYRESAWPETMRLIRELRDSGVAAAVSGAGPSVLAMLTDEELPPGIDYGEFTPNVLLVDHSGVVVESLSQSG